MDAAHDPVIPPPIIATLKVFVVEVEVDILETSCRLITYQKWK